MSRVVHAHAAVQVAEVALLQVVLRVHVRVVDLRQHVLPYQDTLLHHDLYPPLQQLPRPAFRSSVGCLLLQTVRF